MASAGARAYNGGLGAEPPAGSRGRAPGQGVRGAKPPEAESSLAFKSPADEQNVPDSVYFAVHTSCQHGLRHCNGMCCCCWALAEMHRSYHRLLHLPTLMTHSPPQAGYLDTGAMVSVVGQIATVHARKCCRRCSRLASWVG